MVEVFSKKIAVFIDADNVSADVARLACDGIIRQGLTLQTVKAYGNFCHKGKAWKEFALQFSANLDQFFSIAKGKNATDIALSVDAVATMYEASWGLDALMIVSADADYVPLVQKAKSKGLDVIGVGASHAPEAYKAACSSWISVDLQGGQLHVQ